MTTVSWDILIMSHAYPNLSLFIAGHIIAPSGVRKSSIKILWLNKCSGRISFWDPIFGFQHPNSRKPFQPDAGLFSIFSRQWLVILFVLTSFGFISLWQALHTSTPKHGFRVTILPPPQKVTLSSSSSLLAPQVCLSTVVMIDVLI